MTSPPRALFVATGGGGDALGALMLSQALAVEPVATATFAWERKMFDPRPGPRIPAEFSGLRPFGSHNWRIPPDARLAEGVSFLPQLAARSARPLFLLDATDGTVGLGRQLAELAQRTQATITILVDVGGDVLATGREPGLRSPLADALVLAAAEQIPGAYVFCMGLGLDGELSENEWRTTVAEAERHGWGRSARLSRRVAAGFRPHFKWHPSEATGMTCLAAMGFRGQVELRGEGLSVSLTQDSARVHRFAYEAVLARNQVARAVASACSLQEAERLALRVCDSTELDAERKVARNNTAAMLADTPPWRGFDEHESMLLDYCDQAAARGIRYLTFRRIAEVLGMRGEAFGSFAQQLAQRHGRSFRAPLWPCRRRERTLQGWHETKRRFGQLGAEADRRSLASPGTTVASLRPMPFD
jgi:hypothetical protein